MTDAFWPVAPIVLCIIAGTLQWACQNYAKLQNLLQMVFATLLLILAATLLTWVATHNTLVLNAGGWSAPFAISFVLDPLSVTALLVISIVSWVISLYQIHDPQLARFKAAFYPGYWLLMLGVIGSITTGDLFNLYVWFEMMLLAAFLLISLSENDIRSALTHYAAQNVLGTLILLFGIALIYGLTGTLNMADIAKHFKQTQLYALPSLMVLFFGLALKGGLFPLYGWLPKAYPTPAVSTSALLSGTITKVVMLILIRLVTLWAPLHNPIFLDTLLVIALFTMTLGVLGAAIQFEFRNILSFHIVSQLGYIALGIALYSKAALLGALYFIIHNIFVKTNLFLVSGFTETYESTSQLKRLGDWLTRYPGLSALFFLSAFSLAGFPPLSGFWGKFLIIKASIQSHAYISAAIAIAVSLLTLYSMHKIWNYVFCQPSSKPQATPSHTTPASVIPQYIAMSVLLAAALLIALVPAWILPWLNTVANSLFHPNDYIQAVLGAHA